MFGTPNLVKTDVFILVFAAVLFLLLTDALKLVYCVAPSTRTVCNNSPAGKLKLQQFAGPPDHEPPGVPEYRGVTDTCQYDFPFRGSELTGHKYQLHFILNIRTGTGGHIIISSYGIGPVRLEAIKQQNIAVVENEH